MALVPQRHVGDRGINIQQSTSPAAVVYDNSLWVFYNGRGHDGIWYTVYDGTRWSLIHNIRDDCSELHIRAPSSPCPLVHDNTLYLFWSNGTHDGISYTTWNGTSFNKSARDIGTISGVGIGLAPYTSPAAASFGGRIYIVWHGSGLDGLYLTTSEGKTDQWTKSVNLNAHVDAIGVAPGSSPCMTVFNDKLYIFYHGKGNDGTWFFTHSDSASGAGEWSNITSIQRCARGNVVMRLTSPAAFTLTSGSSGGSSQRLGLFWTGAGNDGVWYSLSDGSIWYAQQSILGAIKEHGLQENSNCSAVEFRGEPYIFWAGSEGGLWYTTRKTYDVVRDKLEILRRLIEHDFDQLRVHVHVDDDVEVSKALEQAVTKRVEKEPLALPSNELPPPPSPSALRGGRMLQANQQNQLAGIAVWGPFIFALAKLLCSTHLKARELENVASTISVMSEAVAQRRNVTFHWNVSNSTGAGIADVTLIINGSGDKPDGGSGPPKTKRGDEEL